MVHVREVSLGYGLSPHLCLYKMKVVAGGEPLVSTQVAFRPFECTTGLEELL